VDIGTSAGVVSADVNADTDLADLYENKEPVVFFDLTAGKLFYQTVIDFQDTWNATDFVNSETIELFGTEYTFDPDNDGGAELIMYGSETTLLVAKGSKETVTFKGKEYTVEVLGGNSDDSSAIVRINGDTRTLKEGDSKTMGGLPIYVKNVFVSNIGGDDVSAQLFVGSNKLVLNANTGKVTVNEVDLDEVVVQVDAGEANWGNVDTITFNVTPSDGDDDHEVNYLLPGGSYTDPVFGAFKFDFVGSKDLMAGKEALSFTRNSDKLDLTFQPKEIGTPAKVTLFDANGTGEDIWHNTTLNDMPEDAIFFYNDGSGTDITTHVLQIDSISEGNNVTLDEDFELIVKDLSHGKTYTVTDGDKALDSDIALFAASGSDKNHIDLSGTSGGAGSPAAYAPVLYTEAGARVNFQINTNSSIAPVWANITSGLNLTGKGGSEPGANRFVVAEDNEADAEDTTAVSFTVTYNWDTTDEEYDLDTSGLTDIGNNDDIEYALTEFGTYVVTETDDNGAYVKAYIPAEEVAYDMFLLPVASEVTVTSATTGGAVALNPISVGMAILDSEANLGSKPYIVVGGPCANTVAAALLNSGANCVEGFTEGKAMIKLFSSQNALLIAGFSGKDTQGACRVLASYTDPKYALSGSEVEVITTTLSDLTVKKLS